MVERRDDEHPASPDRYRRIVTAAAPADDDVLYPSVLPFLAIHLGCVAAWWTGVTGRALLLCAALYVLRMFAVTAGYHRYFSHRAFATGRVFQFVLACLAQSSAQKSILWWAAKHRHHHRWSDTPEDVHSPRHAGFLHSHLGWIFIRRHDCADLTRVADLTRYPELVWLHEHEMLPPFMLGLLCLALAGWSGFVVGFLWSTVLVYHATFAINSLAHVHGTRRYLTGDDSRNNWLLALLTMGEGWHNNHHAWQSSARQGFRWWEVDATWGLLRLLARIGVVRNLAVPPRAVVRGEQRLGARVVQRTAEQLAQRFNPERIAAAVAAALQTAELGILQERLLAARERAAQRWAATQLRGERWRHLPQLPARADLVAEARRLFAPSGGLDEIVDRAHELLLVAIGRHLVERGPLAESTIA